MFKNHMTYIKFDKVIQHLISKFSKEKPIFFVFCIFLNEESSWSHDFFISGTFGI